MGDGEGVLEDRAVVTVCFGALSESRHAFES